MSIGQSVTLETLEHKQTHRENEKMTGTGTKSLAKAISAAHKQGKSYRDIAGQLGISQSVVIIAVRKQEAKIAAMQKARRLDETQADTKLQPYQVVGISDESKSGQSPSNIAETLGIPVHDVKRILKALDGNESNLGRVVCVEKYGVELYDAITTDLRGDNRATIESVYGLNGYDLDEIERSTWHSIEPTEREWAALPRNKVTRKTNRTGAYSPAARAIINEANEVIASMLPGCTLPEADIITKTLWGMRLPHQFRLPLVTNASDSVIAMYNEWYALHLLIDNDLADQVRTNVWKLRINVQKIEPPF